jgi:hypothetical protein
MRLVLVNILPFPMTCRRFSSPAKSYKRNTTFFESHVGLAIAATRIGPFARRNGMN